MKYYIKTVTSKTSSPEAILNQHICDIYLRGVALRRGCRRKGRAHNAPRSARSETGGAFGPDHQSAPPRRPPVHLQHPRPCALPAAGAPPGRTAPPPPPRETSITQLQRVGRQPNPPPLRWRPCDMRDLRALTGSSHGRRPGGAGRGRAPPAAPWNGAECAPH